MGSLSLNAHKNGFFHSLNIFQASLFGSALGVLGVPGTKFGNCLTPCL